MIVEKTLTAKEKANIELHKSLMEKHLLSGDMEFFYDLVKFASHQVIEKALFLHLKKYAEEYAESKPGPKIKKTTIAELKELITQVNLGKISYGRMAEIINYENCVENTSDEPVKGDLIDIKVEEGFSKSVWITSFNGAKKLYTGYQNEQGEYGYHLVQTNALHFAKQIRKTLNTTQLAYDEAERKAIIFCFAIGAKSEPEVIKTLTKFILSESK